MKTGNTDFIYRNGLDKTCFQHDMAYENQKIRRIEESKSL